MSSSGRRKPTRRPAPAAAPSRRRLPILWIAVGAVLVLLAVAVVISAGGGDETDEFGSPTVSGDPLPDFVPDAADPALGTPIPEVSGADFSGDPVSITRDGRPKAIVFLAHWCSHCQAEVPAIQAWLDDNEVPGDVEIVSVATGTDPARPNYPPSSWLDDEGWTPPVIVDDEGFAVGNAYGLSAFPYWVYVDSDGNVVGRTSGETSVEAFASILEQLAAS